MRYSDEYTTKRVVHGRPDPTLPDKLAVPSPLLQAYLTASMEGPCHTCSKLEPPHFAATDGMIPHVGRDEQDEEKES